MIVGVQVTATEVTVGAISTANLAPPDFDESSTDVAVTVSEPEVGTVPGAVYSPELETLPEIADQVTAEL
jgi:hypothetical protein